MGSQPIVQMNRATGEVYEDHVPMLVPRRRTYFSSLFGDQWMILAQNALMNIAQNRSLNPESKNVMMFLFGRLEFDNNIIIPQTEVAEALGMRKQNVYRAFKQLEDEGIIFRGPKVGRLNSWRLNPEIGYKGTPSPDRVRRDKDGQLRLVK